jgi:hypothetical protein
MLSIDMLAICEDNQKQAASRTLIKAYPEVLIRMALSETKNASLEGWVTTTRGAYFTDTLKRLAALRKHQARITSTD